MCDQFTVRLCWYGIVMKFSGASIFKRTVVLTAAIAVLTRADIGWPKVNMAGTPGSERLDFAMRGDS